MRDKNASKTNSSSVRQRWRLDSFSVEGHVTRDVTASRREVKQSNVKALSGTELELE